MTVQSDFLVIGRGIVGLATGLWLRELWPQGSLTMLEKEDAIARHQTGHNSGGIHAGIYYQPGSHKARLCVEGVHLMKSFCDSNDVAYENCGKLIVATGKDELSRLETLRERGAANGVPGLRSLSSEEVREIEPHVRAVAG